MNYGNVNHVSQHFNITYIFHMAHCLLLSKPGGSSLPAEQIQAQAAAVWVKALHVWGRFFSLKNTGVIDYPSCDVLLYNCEI